MAALSTSRDEFETKGRQQKTIQLGLPILTVMWCVIIGIGLTWIWEHEATPGEVTQSPTQWPTDSRVERNSNHLTLIVFAHPRCPCTRASLNELALIMSRCSGRIDTRVLFYRPAGFVAEWEQTDLWDSAQSIPGVNVAIDESGSEAKRFGATTSGYSLLYDRSGQLVFHGGITGSRGHCGDNPGRAAIESLALNGESDRNHTFVFGCPLLGRDKACCRKPR
ncbi:hypothetical protein Pan258_35900 [Symmachiella dynata]|nr:hypothetical protein Pan258_35900 [Symmachiella dynata]